MKYIFVGVMLLAANASAQVIGKETPTRLLGEACDAAGWKDHCDELLRCDKGLETCQLAKTYTTTIKKRRPPKREVAFDLTKARRRGHSWDIQAEIGLRLLPNRLRCHKKTCFPHNSSDIRRGWPAKAFDWGPMDPSFPMFGRVQVGWLWLEEPWVATMGLTASYGGLGGFAIGTVTELTHIWRGFWVQFHPAWVIGRGYRMSTAAGFSTFGVEWMTIPMDGVHAVLIKIRIPIGLIRYVKSNF